LYYRGGERRGGKKGIGIWHKNPENIGREYIGTKKGGFGGAADKFNDYRGEGMGTESSRIKSRNLYEERNSSPEGDVNCGVTDPPSKEAGLHQSSRKRINRSIHAGLDVWKGLYSGRKENPDTGQLAFEKRVATNAYRERKNKH